MSSNPVEEAKAVIRSHERLAMQGDLAGVLSNVADDIVVLAAGAPLVEGREAFREFYGGVLEMGDQDFGHDYSSAEVVGDLVVLCGVSRGTVTTRDGEVVEFANNFIHTLRRQSDGRFLIWRAAFAPAG